MSKCTKKLRCDTAIKYVGDESDSIPAGKLPTTRQVLSFFFKLCRDSVNDKRAAARGTVREVMKMWDRTKIPTVQEIRGIEKIEKLYKEWTDITRHPDRNSNAQQHKCVQFTSKLDVLFDLSKTDATLNMTRNELKGRDEQEKQMWREEIEFLQDQRGLRVFSMGGVDEKLRKKAKKMAEAEERKKLTEANLQKRKEMHFKKSRLSGELAELEDSDSSLSSETGSIFDAGEGSETSGTSSRGRIDVLTPEVVEALDANAASSGGSCSILAACTRALGVDVKSTNINPTTVYRKRESARAKSAAEIKKYLPENEDEVVTALWDGKIVPSLEGGDGTQEREAVSVKGIKTDQILGAPFVEKGNAEQICFAVFALLVEWGLTHKVKALAFDTTAVNSGCWKGVATRLERELGRDLLWLPCRHHVYERILEAVYRGVMGPSFGPKNDIFNDLRKNWHQYDVAKYSTFRDLAISEKALSGCADEIIAFAKAQIKAKQVRADYLELLQLTIIYLGGVPDGGVIFRAPGEVSDSRWMSTAIYTLKEVLFRKQVKLSKAVTNGLVQVAIFVVKVYIKGWYTATESVCAPRNDLSFLQDLLSFEKYNKEISRAALTRFLGHTWYLTEVNVALSLFDDQVSVAEKEKLVSNMRINEGDPDMPKKRDLQTMEFQKMTISDFSTKNTFKFFEILGISCAFLDHTVNDWAERDDFRKAKDIVTHLPVVNDISERGVRLFKKFNRTVTKKEKSYQELLVTVHILEKPSRTTRRAL